MLQDPGAQPYDRVGDGLLNKVDLEDERPDDHERRHETECPVNGPGDRPDGDGCRKAQAAGTLDRRAEGGASQA